MTELVTFGETPLRVSPPGAERLERAVTAELHADGTESNVAVAAACLGADATWLSRLPSSPLGRRITRELEQHGANTEVAWIDDPEGRIGLRYYEAAAKPRPAGTYHDREDSTAARTSPADIPMELIQGAEVLFTGATTPTLSESAFETTEAIMRAGGGAGAITAMDVDHQPGLRSIDEIRETVLSLTEHLDVLLVNQETAKEVFSRSGNARELANGLVAEHDLDMAVITRSQRGAVVMHDKPGTNVLHERDTVETDAVDPTGQHEALAGGFLQRLIDGADAAEALSYGVATAALARTVPGPMLTVERADVDRVVEDVEATSR